MNNTTVSIPGYRISEEVYNGSRTLVYRGYRKTDELPVVIKLLKNPYPSFSELLWFRNQYTIAKNLNSPLIIQTYSLEQYQNGYVLVMEDFGGISLKEWGVERDAINRVCTREWGMGGRVEGFNRVFRNSDRTMQYLRYTLPLAHYFPLVYKQFHRFWEH